VLICIKARDLGDEHKILEQIKCDVDERDIHYIKNRYKGCIFTEVDKNQNTWGIMCPIEYNSRMKETF